MTKPLGRSRERTVLLLSFWSVMYKLINPFYLDAKRKLCCQIFVFLQGGGEECYEAHAPTNCLFQSHAPPVCYVTLV